MNFKALLSVSFAIGPATLLADSYVAIKAERQKKSLWCWAAAAQELAAQAGHSFSQEEIVRKTKGWEVDEVGRVEDALRAIGLKVQIMEGSPARSTIARILDSKHTIAIWCWPEGQRHSHMLVIHGIADDGVMTVWNPLTGVSKKMTSLELQLAEGRWERSYFIASEPQRVGNTNEAAEVERKFAAAYRKMTQHEPVRTREQIEREFDVLYRTKIK